MRKQNAHPQASVRVIKLYTSHNNKLKDLWIKYIYSELVRHFESDVNYTTCLEMAYANILGKVDLKGYFLSLKNVLREISLRFYLRTESVKLKIKTVATIKLREDVRLDTSKPFILNGQLEEFCQIYLFNKSIYNNALFTQHCQETFK